MKINVWDIETGELLTTCEYSQVKTVLGRAIRKEYVSAKRRTGKPRTVKVEYKGKTVWVYLEKTE
jgi:hypothetical protein